jgi:hypothetical protein
MLVEQPLRADPTENIRFDRKIHSILFFSSEPNGSADCIDFAAKTRAKVCPGASNQFAAAVDRQRGRLKFSSHDPSLMSVFTPFSAIDPSQIASSGAKPNRAEFFQTKTETHLRTDLLLRC